MLLAGGSGAAWELHGILTSSHVVQAKKEKQFAKPVDASGGGAGTAIVDQDDEMAPGIDEAPPGDPEAPKSLDEIEV